MEYATHPSMVDVNKQVEEWCFSYLKQTEEQNFSYLKQAEERKQNIEVFYSEIRGRIVNHQTPQAPNPICFQRYSSSPPLISSPRIKPPEPPDRPPPSKKEFPRFDGSMLREWLHRCEHFFWLNNTLPEMKVRLMSLHMDGKALKWHHNFMANHYGIFPPWSDYIIAVFAQFDEPSPAVNNTSTRGCNVYDRSNKPPVEEFRRPLYGDVFCVQAQNQSNYNGKPIDKDELLEAGKEEETHDKPSKDYVKSIDMVEGCKNVNDDDFQPQKEINSKIKELNDGDSQKEVGKEDKEVDDENSHRETGNVKANQEKTTKEETKEKVEANKKRHLNVNWSNEKVKDTFNHVKERYGLEAPLMAAGANPVLTSREIEDEQEEEIDEEDGFNGEFRQIVEKSSFDEYVTYEDTGKNEEFSKKEDEKKKVKSDSDLDKEEKYNQQKEKNISNEKKKLQQKMNIAEFKRVSERFDAVKERKYLQGKRIEKQSLHLAYFIDAARLEEISQAYIAKEIIEEEAGAKKMRHLHQVSCCSLIHMKDDVVEGIYETLKECYAIGKSTGGEFGDKLSLVFQSCLPDDDIEAAYFENDGLRSYRRKEFVWSDDGGCCTHYCKGHKGVLSFFSSSDDAISKNHFPAMISVAISEDVWLLLKIQREKAAKLWDLYDYSSKIAVATYEKNKKKMTVSQETQFIIVDESKEESKLVRLVRYKEEIYSCENILIVTKSKDKTIKLWNTTSKSHIGVGIYLNGDILAVGVEKKSLNFCQWKW